MYIKDFHVTLSERPEDNLNHMIDMMASDIVKGKRILFPTTNGILYKTKLEAQLVKVLEAKYGYKRRIVVNYYRKENVGDKFTEQHVKETLMNTNVLLCDTYFPILDYAWYMYDYNVYLTTLYIPQKIQKLLNDLHHDMFFYIFLNKYDGYGNLMIRDFSIEDKGIYRKTREEIISTIM